MNPYTQRLHDKIDEFLQDWLDWAEGRPHKDDHLDCVGLCSNLSGYILGLPEDLQDDIESEFRRLLKDDYLFKEDYPFDESELAYRQDEDKHRNPKRLAWVKQRLGAS